MLKIFDARYREKVMEELSVVEYFSGTTDWLKTVHKLHNDDQWQLHKST